MSELDFLEEEGRLKYFMYPYYLQPPFVAIMYLSLDIIMRIC